MLRLKTLGLKQFPLQYMSLHWIYPPIKQLPILRKITPTLRFKFYIQSNKDYNKSVDKVKFSSPKLCNLPSIEAPPIPSSNKLQVPKFGAD